MSEPSVAIDGTEALAAHVRQALALAPRRDSSDFDLDPALPAPPAGRLRPAGVLMGITPRRTMLLTVRSAGLRQHPGQIAFPGGKVDLADAGPVAAALREATEEIGMPAGAARVLGTLPAHRTVTSYSVTPVVALLDGFAPVARPGEVEEVFEVPMEFLMDLGNYAIEGRRFQGRTRRYYAIPWRERYIWGATARMLHALAERLQ